MCVRELYRSVRSHNNSCHPTVNIACCSLALYEETFSQVVSTIEAIGREYLVSYILRIDEKLYL